MGRGHGGTTPPWRNGPLPGVLARRRVGGAARLPGYFTHLCGVGPWPAVLARRRVGGARPWRTDPAMAERPLCRECFGAAKGRWGRALAGVFHPR